MKIVVTSQGTDRESLVDSHFGRARYFLVCDLESGEVTSHDNGRNLDAEHGAGTRAGQHVVSLGVEAVVTGNVGPKAFQVLRAGGVAVYVGPDGTEETALDALAGDQLAGPGTEEASPRLPESNAIQGSHLLQPGRPRSLPHAVSSPHDSVMRHRGAVAHGGGVKSDAATAGNTHRRIS